MVTIRRTPPRAAGTYVNVIRGISKRTPEHAEKPLRSYLTNEKEIVRAVAMEEIQSDPKVIEAYIGR